MGRGGLAAALENAGVHSLWRRRLAGEDRTRRSAGEERSRRLAGISRTTLLHKVAPVAVLIALMAGYALYYGLWSIRKYDAFQAPAFDIGIFDQGVWLLSRFKEPFVTVLGLNLFGDHVSFIMLLFVPFYWLWPGPETLLVIQAMVLALGAIPVYLLARTILRSQWFALVPSLAYLLTPALGWLNLENFHPDCLEVPLLLFALYFVVCGRWRPYLVMVCLLLTVKEDMVLVLVPLGLYVALCHNRKMGLLTAGLAVVWFVVVFFGAQPKLSGALPGSLDSWRIPFGGFGGLIKTAFGRPWEVIAYMVTADKVRYLFQLLTPVLFLPLLTARTLVIVPVLFFNLISNFWYQSNLQYHYHSSIIPVFCVMALLALERFKGLKLRRALVVVALLAAAFSLYMWGPVQGTREPSYYPDPQHPQAVAATEALALIPSDAVVAAEDKFASHLTNRERIYVFPTPFSASYWGDDSQKGQRLRGAEAVEYVVAMPAYMGEESANAYTGLAEEGFSVIYDKEGVVVLKRAEPEAERVF
jgi:uncharacterized membrane protein